MPCYTPLSAYQARSVNPKTGKRPVVFHLRDGFHDLPIQLPCGQCVGCRLERSRQWAIRAMHEASMHKHSVFVTLTYSDEALEKAGNSILRELRHDDFQKFMKRLRKKFGAGIRYYMCGEYGEKFGRPHYHAAIFGLTFKDKKLFKNFRGQKLYTSEILTQLWGHGHASFGSVTFNSAAYIARYVTKKSLAPQGPNTTLDWMSTANMYQSRKNTSRRLDALVSEKPGLKNTRQTFIPRTTSTLVVRGCDHLNITTFNTKSLNQKKCKKLKCSANLRKKTTSKTIPASGSMTNGSSRRLTRKN